MNFEKKQTDEMSNKMQSQWKFVNQKSIIVNDKHENIESDNNDKHHDLETTAEKTNDSINKNEDANAKYSENNFNSS